MTENDGWLVIQKEQALAYGKKVSGGFVVRAGSTTMREGSPKVKRNRAERDQLVSSGILVPDSNPALLRFAEDHVFSSISTAAGVVIDGNSNGSHWQEDSSSDESSEPEIFSREDIEAAMDAFDAYRSVRAHSEIFDAFGEPRDYWVRSTRKRQDRAYPTKPLVGYILKSTDLNGGWGQKASAAARLHNAGFIIVDRSDAPALPPERVSHLLRDADRIRLCALNYFIEPARERGASSVAIRAGDLALAMGLKDAFPNICQALGGDKFQKLAKVPAPTYTEPNPSSSTTFTYQLGSKAESNAVTEVTSINSPYATNLILYGPPGTGKTYATAWEAVRLCLGNDTAAALENDRDALMAEYRRLVGDGRIEFLTFHQSLSYEEFVEGLRPSTGDDDIEGSDDTDGATGFRLKCHEGIFKRISERARLDQGGSNGSPRLDRSARVFKIALGRRHVEDDRIRYGLDNDLIHLGWGDNIDWSDERFDEFNEIFSEWRSKKDPEANGQDGNIVCTFSFRADMQVGDYVVVSDGRDRIQALGRVSSEYYFDADASYHPHRRRVEWLWRDDAGTERGRFYPNAFRRHSVYKLNQSLIDWDALEEIAFGNENPSARNATSVPNEVSLTVARVAPGDQLLDDPVTHTVSLFDLEDLEVDAPAEGTLFTVGALPRVQDHSLRHLAQDVAVQLARKYPNGFSLNQYREALVKAGEITGIEPSGGWGDNSWPNWLRHPDQRWLVPVAEKNSIIINSSDLHDKETNYGDLKNYGQKPEATQYVMIIDEINRANISKVFGELITLLEQDKRLGAQNEVRVQLPYSKKQFGVPSNLHIIGTMNTADRSIALLDTALRRRFTFRELMPDPSVLSDNVDGINLQELLRTINERIEYLFDREHQIGHAYFTGCRSRPDVEDVMRHKVIPLLAEYFYEDWSKVAAVLGDGPATSRNHFLEAISLPPPKGMSEDDLNGDKLRWSVKAEFDFSEFEA